MMSHPRVRLVDEAVEVSSPLLLVVSPARIRHVPEPPITLKGIIEAPQAVLTVEFVGTVGDYGGTTIEPVDV